MSTISDMYEIVVALFGVAFSSWLIHQILFADTRMTEDERKARRERRRKLHGLKPRNDASKAKVDQKPIADNHERRVNVTKPIILRPVKPQSSLAALGEKMMETSSNKVIREAKKRWQVKEDVAPRSTDTKPSLNMTKTSSSKMMRRTSSGWRVNEIVLADEVVAMSRVLSLTRAICRRDVALRSAAPESSLNMVRTFSNKVVAEASRGWQVKEVVLTDDMLMVSRALSSNPAICSGW